MDDVDDPFEQAQLSWRGSQAIADDDAVKRARTEHGLYGSVSALGIVEISEFRIKADRPRLQTWNAGRKLGAKRALKP